MIEQRLKIGDFYAQMVDFCKPGHILLYIKLMSVHHPHTIACDVD